jgi:hypothetical protein
MHGIIKDKRKRSRDTRNSTCHALNSLLGTTLHSLKEQIKDKLCVIARDPLVSNLPSFPIPAEHRLSCGIYKWLFVDMITSQ